MDDARLHFKTQARREVALLSASNVVAAWKLCSDFNNMHVSGFISKLAPQLNRRLSVQGPLALWLRGHTGDTSCEFRLAALAQAPLDGFLTSIANRILLPWAHTGKP